MERSPDFIEAIARGLDVIRAFGSTPHSMSLSEVAAAAGLARPTARRILITLAELGYVRHDNRGFTLTPRVLDLGTAYIARTGLWEVANPHLADLSRLTGESCSIGQLDGADVVYVARASVPKLVTLTATVGTRFPAAQTSLGKVLMAALDAEGVEAVLSAASRSAVAGVRAVDRHELERELDLTRERGWALTDQQLGPGIRSIATAIRNADGKTVAAVNVNAHAAETSLTKLTDEYLPLLLNAADAITSDVSRLNRLPLSTPEHMC